MGFSVLAAEQRFLHHRVEKIHRYWISHPPPWYHLCWFRNQSPEFGGIVLEHGPQIRLPRFEGIRTILALGHCPEEFGRRNFISVLINQCSWSNLIPTLIILYFQNCWKGHPKLPKWARTSKCPDSSTCQIPQNRVGVRFPRSRYHHLYYCVNEFRISDAKGKTNISTNWRKKCKQTVIQP